MLEQPISQSGVPIIPQKKPLRKQRAPHNPFEGLRLWSALTHGLGVLAGLVGGGLLIARGLEHGLTWRIIPLLVYVCTMVGLYTASTLYHSVRTSIKGRIALRQYDHCSIYFLIAGTYTPLCFLGLPPSDGAAMGFLIWVLAVGGTLLTLLWKDAPRWLRTGIYLVMGWLSAFLIPAFLTHLPPEGTTWLLVGGIFYTIGGLLYALKWPGRNNPRFGCHEIFHVFILLGSVAHFVMIYGFIAPLS